MPIYEYLCTKCGAHLEVMQGINDKPLRRCKECSGKLEKQISRTSFQLKGGGWYDSGYSKDSSSSATSSSSSSESKSSSSKKDTSKSTGKKEAKAASA